MEGEKARYVLDHALGTIYGNCMGDAIGLLTEFYSKKTAHQYLGQLHDLEYSHKEIVNDMHRSRWKTGDWTDDSDQMILIMDSICDTKHVESLDYSKKLKRWVQVGFPELGDLAGLGLGATTHHVMKHPQYKDDPIHAAKDVWEKTGCHVAPNGGVMRTSALGIYQYENLDAVMDNTLKLCMVTHYDPRCQASCVAVTSAVAMILNKGEENKPDISAIVEESFQKAVLLLPEDNNKKGCFGSKKMKRQYKDELKSHMFATKIDELKLDEDGKIGYTLKTMGAGFWALRQDNFRTALQAVVMEAGDADTNGAVAGALLGCKLGYKVLRETVPTWIDGMCHKAWLDRRIRRYFLECFPTWGEYIDELFPQNAAEPPAAAAEPQGVAAQPPTATAEPQAGGKTEAARSSETRHSGDGGEHTSPAPSPSAAVETPPKSDSDQRSPQGDNTAVSNPDGESNPDKSPKAGTGDGHSPAKVHAGHSSPGGVAQAGTQV